RDFHVTGVQTCALPISFSNANIRELSAYNFVNEIHDYYVMKAMGSGAEAIMDFQMQSHIDVAGTCNAYYDGDLNFYAAGGNCNRSEERRVGKGSRSRWR